MNRRFGIFLLVLTLLFGGFSVPAAQADDMWIKLGRGINNIAFGMLEVLYQPKNMYDDGVRMPIAIVGGIPKGLLYGVTRMVVGVYETATFLVPVPSDYRMIMAPEFIVPAD